MIAPREELYPALLAALDPLVEAALFPYRAVVPATLATKIRHAAEEVFYLVDERLAAMLARLQSRATEPMSKPPRVVFGRARMREAVEIFRRFQRETGELADVGSPEARAVDEAVLYTLCDFDVEPNGDAREEGSRILEFLDGFCASAVTRFVLASPPVPPGFAVLKAAARALSREESDLYRLRFLEGLEMASIGDRLAISSDMAGRRYHAVMRRLGTRIRELHLH